MSNQVYSNFETRKLYRSSESLDCQTMGPNQIVPDSLAVQNVGPFLLLPVNANYTYVPSTGFLQFHTEGVYAISLNTIWTTTNDNGVIAQYMDIDGASLPKFGYVTAKPVVGVTPSSLYSNIVLRINAGQNIRFRCFANNTGTQTIIGSSGNPRSEFCVSKLS